MSDLVLVIVVLLVLALIGVIAVKVIFPLLVFALVGGFVAIAGWIAYRIYDSGRKRKIDQMERELQMQRRHLETVRLLQKQNTELEAQLRAERLKRITEASVSTNYMTTSRM